MTANRITGSPLRKTLTRAAMVCTAAAAVIGLTGTNAMAAGDWDATAANFTLNQPDWYAGNSANSSSANLVFQSDGNLVLYANDGRALWASGTYGQGVNHVDWSASGYIKLQHDNDTICTIGKLNSAPGGRAVVQADGNFVFYQANGSPAWSSGTNGLSQGTADYCAS
ncbi:hypothetical protein [Saccharothrix sp. ST-888]|uniref:hypothetical protein n=1 Tax=Saccharothrix sp. ST-888 TaxID=1427391 RepID=UPI0005EC0E07|nr:hypothetical protein [Saccharothrix sp. ST-888]KJK58402.1 hypothetical protein UK12_10845 [Saccharothrix sp. ST-888]